MQLLPPAEISLSVGGISESNNARFGGHQRTFWLSHGMSTLPPKADMCGALGDVRLVPIADIVSSIRLNKKPPNPAMPEGFPATN
jgi:hypothetical protein